MAVHRIGDGPLSEPIPTRFTDAYMRHLREMSFNAIRDYRPYVGSAISDGMEFNDNEFNPVLSKNIRGQKHPMKVCN